MGGSALLLSGGALAIGYAGSAGLGLYGTSSSTAAQKIAEQGENYSATVNLADKTIRYAGPNSEQMNRVSNMLRNPSSWNTGTLDRTAELARMHDTQYQIAEQGTREAAFDLLSKFLDAYNKTHGN